MDIQFSPDGTRLAWTSWPSRNAKITVLDTDTLKIICEASSPVPPKLASQGLIYEWNWDGLVVTEVVVFKAV